MDMRCWFWRELDCIEKRRGGTAMLMDGMRLETGLSCFLIERLKDNTIMYLAIPLDSMHVPGLEVYVLYKGTLL